MNADYYRNFLSAKYRQKQQLLTQRENLEIKGLCPKKDSCEKCRNARINSPEYMALLSELRDVDIQIGKATKKLDYLIYCEKYLNWTL